MFHLPRSLRLLAVSLLASLIPIGAARADHFKFIVDFTSGPLNGSVYIGYFATSDPIGDFTPDAAYGNQLLSMAITIDGAKFIMQDDVDFPHFPRIRINSVPNNESFDFIARGSATALHDKWLEIRLHGTNNVNFGTVRGGKVVVESFGYLYDIFRIDPREVPPEPQCQLCHSRLQR